MNHISLETAKKLHQLGYSKETYFVWAMSEGIVVDMPATPTILPRNHESIFVEVNPIPAPLAEELLEVLPKKLHGPDEKDTDYSLTIRWDGEDWDADYMFYDVSLDPNRCINDTHLAEALALLLIDLVEQGIINKDSLTDKK